MSIEEFDGDVRRIYNMALPILEMLTLYSHIDRPRKVVLSLETDKQTEHSTLFALPWNN